MLRIKRAKGIEIEQTARPARGDNFAIHLEWLQGVLARCGGKQGQPLEQCRIKRTPIDRLALHIQSLCIKLGLCPKPGESGHMAVLHISQIVAREQLIDQANRLAHVHHALVRNRLQKQILLDIPNLCLGHRLPGLGHGPRFRTPTRFDHLNAHLLRPHRFALVGQLRRAEEIRALMLRDKRKHVSRRALCRHRAIDKIDGHRRRRRTPGQMQPGRRWHMGLRQSPHLRGLDHHCELNLLADLDPRAIHRRLQRHILRPRRAGQDEEKNK